jgi:hypothetical protein
MQVQIAGMIVKIDVGMLVRTMIYQTDVGSASSPNCEYPLRNGLCSDAARPLLQAGLVVLATLCSIFVELTQVQCHRFGHKTCKRIMQVLRPTLSHGTC